MAALQADNDSLRVFIEEWDEVWGEAWRQEMDKSLLFTVLEQKPQITLQNQLIHRFQI